MKLRIATSLLLAGLTLTAPTSVLGQDSQTANQGGIDEIIVTAQRRPVTLLDTTSSVTVLDESTLRSAGIQSTRDLERLTPSLQMQAFGGWLQPSIRGISSKGASPGDSSNVAIYVDGVYQPNQAGQLFDLPDVSRVEVLKGPQGSLYGQNATGGAILITTHEPGSEPHGRFYGGYGSFSEIIAGGYVSSPITHSLSGSLSGQYHEHDGYRRNLTTGERDFGLRSSLVRGKVRYQPSDSASLTLGGMYSNRKDSLFFGGLALNGNSVGYLFAPDLAVPEGNRQMGATDAYSEFTTSQLSLRGEFDIGDGVLNTVSAYNRVELAQFADVDYTPVHFATSTPNPRQSTFIHELNYASEKKDRWSWVGGIFYMHSEDAYPGTGGFRLYSGMNVAPMPAGDPVLFAPFIGSLHKDAYAAYLEGNYDLLDQLTLTVGGRYSYERQRGFAAFVFDGSQPPATELAGGPQHFTKFTPQISLVYKPVENTSIYASYSRGFKSGMINILDAGGATVQPENVTGYEVGVRRRHGIAFTELSIYRYKYEDLQVSAYVAPDYIYENAGAARINGAELTLVEMSPVDNLSLTAGAHYMDAKYTRYQGAPVVLTAFVPNALGAGNDQVALDVTGNRLERAPTFVGSLSGRYTIFTTGGEIGLFTSVYHNSGYAIEPGRRIRQSSFATVDAELSFAPRGMENARLILEGRNLTDRAYIQSSLITVFADGVSYAPPRTYGVRLEYMF